MGRCTRYSWAVALAVLLAVPLLASAEDAGAEEPTEEALEEAKIHFKAGKLYYEKGKYRQAITSFESGYDLVKRPAFLLNIAQCQRKLGNTTKAREYYRRYLEEEPQAGQRAAVEKIIAELDAEIAQAHGESEGAVAAVPEESPPREAAQAASGGAGATGEPDTAAVAQQSDEAETARSVPPAALPGPQPDGGAVAARRRVSGNAEDENRSIFRSPLFWVVVGAVAVAGGGAALYLSRDDYVKCGSLGCFSAMSMGSAAR